MDQATTLQIVGAGAFGFLIGWYIYYVNRYRKDDVQLSDIVTLIGIIGGGAVLALFPAKSTLFGAYGIGLCAGFFFYLIVLAFLVKASKNFDRDWFLDGRRQKPKDPYYIPGETVTPPRPPMEGGQGNVRT